MIKVRALYVFPGDKMVHCGVLVEVVSKTLEKHTILGRNLMVVFKIGKLNYEYAVLFSDFVTIVPRKFVKNEC